MQQHQAVAACPGIPANDTQCEKAVDIWNRKVKCVGQKLQLLRHIHQPVHKDPPHFGVDVFLYRPSLVIPRPPQRLNPTISQNFDNKIRPKDPVFVDQNTKHFVHNNASNFRQSR